MLVSQRSKEHNLLFATLPNKHKTMSPASKKPSKIISDANSDIAAKEEDFPTTERDIGINFHERFSKLMLVAKNENKSKLLGANGEFDGFIAFQKSLESYHELKRQGGEEVRFLEVDRNGGGRESGVNGMKTENGGKESTNRSSSSPEKKSVRFADEILEKQFEDNEIEENVFYDDLRRFRVCEEQLASPLCEQINAETECQTRCRNTKQSESKTESLPGKFIYRKTKSESETELNEPQTCNKPTNHRKTMPQNPFNITPNKVFEPKDFQCSECEKTFKYRSNLKSHVLAVHNGAMCKSNGMVVFNSTDDFLVCDVCSKFFKYSVNLRAHKAGHTRLVGKLSSTI